MAGSIGERIVPMICTYVRYLIEREKNPWARRRGIDWGVFFFHHGFRVYDVFLYKKTKGLNETGLD